MTIQIDSREKARAIQKILAELDKQNIQHFVSKLPVGDYQSLDNARLVIDRKQNLNELCGNLGKGINRFTNELKLAKRLGIKLIILCEHGGAIKSLQDVFEWQNPRRKIQPGAKNGSALYRQLRQIQYRYDVEFAFCDKAHTGQRIIQILSDGGINNGVSV